MDKRHVFFKKKDILIILIIAAVALSFIIFRSFRNSGVYAIISVDSKTVKEINLKTSGDMDFTVNGIDGITFKIENGKIAFLSSNCPDKICVKTGYISKPGEIAVCLPKKVLLEIKNEKTKSIEKAD